MKKFIYFLILIIFSNSTVFAIEGKKIDLNEAIQITLLANPRVKIESLKVESAKNDIKVAGHFQNPELYTFQNIGNTGKGEPQQVGVDYTIEILKRGKRQAYAKSQSDVALQNQQDRQQLLILNVKKAYIDLLLKKSIYHILLDQQELSRELLDSACEEADAGKLPKTDVIQAKIALNRAIMLSNTAKSEVIFAQNHLNSVMNTSEFNYDTKEDHLTDDYSSLNAISPIDDGIDFEKIKSYALDNRYDLLRAKQEVESAKKNLEIVKSKLIPDVTLSGGYAYQTKHISQNNSAMSGAFAGARLVNVPLVYRYKPEIKNAEIEIEKAKLRLEDMTIDVVRDLTDAWEKFVIARDNLNFYNEELLTNSRELLNESMSSLTKKEIDITSFLVSKKLYLDLILGYQDALGQYYTSYAELLREVNSDTINIIDEV